MKILYLMHVDWGWIKQRPHFIAECLAEHNDIMLFYPFSYRHRSTHCANKTSKIKPYAYFQIPFSRFECMYFLTTLWLKCYFSFVIAKFKPEFIWLCHPDLIRYISRSKRSLVVYDCMDDHFAMGLKKQRITKNEKLIVSVAKHIFASSQSLINKLETRYAVKAKDITLIRNAFNGKIIDLQTQTAKRKEIFHICYVGTVSTWFDFDVIDAIVEKFSDVFVEIIGPVESAIKDKVSAYKGSRVYFHGSVEHDKLYDAVKDYDCMIMPFQLNETVLSVDPVKLYEYINYYKNIICVKYDEVNYFKDFVHFYNTKDEICEIVEKLMADNTLKYSNEQRTEFLKKNSWADRVSQIEESIGSN